MSAFDNFPKNQQPDIIMIKDYNKIAKNVENITLQVSDKVYIPPCNKISGKKTTKDIDIFAVFKSKNWKNEIKTILGDRLVTSISNGRQLMCVVTDVINDNKQYFLDFNTVKAESFVWASTFYNTSSLIPIIVGRFARSLGYKLTESGLKINIKDSGGVEHIETLTKNPEDMFRIFMLDEEMFNTIKNGRYLNVIPNNIAIAIWITQSPRFCYKTWSNLNNNNSHKHACRKDDVIECLKLIDEISKNCKHIKPYDNESYFIEDFVLGEGFMDDLEYKIENERKRMLENADVLDGRVIMDKLNIKGGPIIGKLKKEANKIKKANPDISDDNIILKLKQYYKNINN